MLNVTGVAPKPSPKFGTASKADFPLIPSLKQFRRKVLESPEPVVLYVHDNQTSPRGKTDRIDLKIVAGAAGERKRFRINLDRNAGIRQKLDELSAPLAGLPKVLLYAKGKPLVDVVDRAVELAKQMTIGVIRNEASPVAR